MLRMTLQSFIIARDPRPVFAHEDTFHGGLDAPKVSPDVGRSLRLAVQRIQVRHPTVHPQEDQRPRTTAGCQLCLSLCREQGRQQGDATQGPEEGTTWNRGHDLNWINEWN